VVVAVPARYVHTHNTIIDISDYTSTLELILKLVETIDGDIAAKIGSFND
jgi:putative aminopeptidase FrvX